MLILRVLLLLAGVVPAQALANGAWSSFPAGGLEFKDNADIAIAKEDLALGLDEVRVRYVFQSRAEAEQTLTIGFPLPRVPAAPDSPDALQGDRGVITDDARNYLGFEVSVDGEPVAPVPHEFAWLGEKNVTADILAAGIPLLPRYERTRYQDYAPEALEALTAAGLIVDDGSGYFSPTWDYQVVYEWQQAFAPGATVAEIRYQPLLGWRGDFGDLYEAGSYAQTACVDGALLEQINALDGYEVAVLEYITTTARHWSGPIGEFNLTVDTTEPADWEVENDDTVIAAVCPADAPTDAEGNRHWSAKDYIPQEDIRVFFYISW